MGPAHPLQKVNGTATSATASRSGSGVLLLVGAGLVLQLGLLMLWMLSFRLTHNQEFTAAYLERFPALRAVLDLLFGAARPVVPNIEPPPDLNLLTAVLAVACGVAAVGYLAGLALVDRGQADGRGALVVVLLFAALYQVTVLVMPGLFSQDIFGYLEYGQIPAVHGLNPYIWPPSSFAHDALLPWVAPIWRTLPSPYGPVWTDLSWALAHPLWERPIVDQVMAYKLLANVLHGLTLGLVWWLVGRLQPGSTRPARLAAFTVFAWNPLVLFESPGNGHNDALMVFLLLLGLVPLLVRVRASAGQGQRPRLRDPRYPLAVVLFTLSGLVKYLSGVVGPLLVLVWARQMGTWRARVGAAVVAGALALVVGAGLFAPWLELPDSLDPLLSQTGGSLYANTVPDVVALTVADQVLVPRGATLRSARATARGWVKIAVDAVAVAYLACELWQLWRASEPGGHAAVTALARSATRLLMVVILLVSIWVQTWYYILPLALAALLGWRSLLTRVVVAYTLTALPVLYVHYYLQDDVPDGIFLLYGGVPLVLPLVASVRSWRRGRPAEPASFAGADQRERSASLAGVYDARLGDGLVDERRQAGVTHAAPRAPVAELHARPRLNGSGDAQRHGPRRDDGPVD